MHIVSDHLHTNKYTEYRNIIHTYLNNTISNHIKIIDYDNINQHDKIIQSLIRMFSESSINDISWRSIRSYFIPENIQIINSNINDSTMNNNNTTIQITGYIRGSPLYINSLMHIANIGVCQLQRVDKLNDPYEIYKYNNRSHNKSSTEMNRKMPCAVSDATK
jgi:hypothetical protein